MHAWRGVMLGCALAAACSGADAGPRVRPNQGGLAGGELVRLEGRDFARHGPPIVYFGAVAARGVVTESDQLIVVFAPPADAPGSVDLRIAFRDGTVVEWPKAYRYAKPRGLTIEAKPAPPAPP